MANEFLWQKACQIDYKLQIDYPSTSNWVERLTLDHIAKLCFPDDETNRKALFMTLNNKVENGTLEFDDIKIFSDWHFLDVLVIFPSYGHHDKWLNSSREQERKIIANQLLAAHKPACRWIELLKGFEQGGSVTLEQHPCQCLCTCKEINRFHNGLPKKWKVTGEHEDGFKVNFSCEAIPIITAKQCFDIFNLIKLPIPEDSVLHGWWEDDIKQLSLANNQDDIKTDGETESIYCKYKASIDALKARGIDLNALTVNAIFKQLKLFDNVLWNMRYESFERNVWQRYKSENGIRGRRGRPRKIASKKQ